MREDEVRALEALERAWGLTSRTPTQRAHEPSTKTDEGEPEDGRAPPKFLLVPFTEKEEYGLPPPRPSFWETLPLTIVVSVVVAVTTVVMFLAATHHNH